MPVNLADRVCEWAVPVQWLLGSVVFVLLKCQVLGAQVYYQEYLRFDGLNSQVDVVAKYIVREDLETERVCGVLVCCCLWNCSDYTEYAVLIWTGLSCANGILRLQLDGVLLSCLKIASSCPSVLQ